MNRILPLTALLTAAAAYGADRDLQYINIVGTTDIIMLQNTGSEPLTLDGWRFCTENSISGPVMSAPGALDGIVVPPHGSFVIRYANDATPNFPSQHNASDIGPLAEFELDAYAISLFAPGSSGDVEFTNPDQMVDHIQWKRNHIPSSFSAACSDVAQAAGLWEDASEWVYVRIGMYLIELTDLSFTEAHSADDYNVILECRADFSDDGVLNFFDISAFLGFYTAQDTIADLSRDGNVDFFDVSLFLQLFNQGGCQFF